MACRLGQLCPWLRTFHAGARGEPSAKAISELRARLEDCNHACTEV